jgi:hypothetical protein
MSRLCICLPLLLAAATAEAKPRPQSDGETTTSTTTRVQQRRARATTRGAMPDLLIGAAFVSQADLRYSPASLGFVASAKKALPTGFYLDGGLAMSFSDRATLYEPRLGAEWDLRTIRQVHVLTGAGIALPIQSYEDRTVVAFGLRGDLGARWHWRYSEWALPRADLALVLGPRLGASDGTYAAVQFLIGADYAL